MTIWHTQIACWIPKATKKHSEYVILIVLPLQQWVHECTQMLCVTYVACLVILLSTSDTNSLLTVTVTGPPHFQWYKNLDIMTLTDNLENAAIWNPVCSKLTLLLL
jgi:hypothetical protein